ncbi:MAG TPA: YfhO family protein [Longimicrobiaceae bacterium]|nr:YfhO family protein [Longimicrobiaceae bacterium]
MATKADPLDHPSWPSTGLAALIFLGLSLLYFIPGFLPGRQIFGTDYLAGGYFFYNFISERLVAGELPRWVPYIYGGLPLFSNPGSTYQPVHFLASLILPTPKVFATVFVFHFWMAGLGMYLLSVELRCRRWIALIAGIAFQFTGLTMSWVYAGHDGRIIVATLAPMVFYFLHRGIRTGRIASFLGLAVTLGFALLSFQIQNAYYLLLGGAAWAIFCLFYLGITRKPPLLARTVAYGLGAVAAAFLLSAMNFLPFMDYIPESPRGGEEGRGYEYSTSYSMPGAEILSLAVPEQAGISVSDPLTGEPLFPRYTGENGFKLHTEYVGAFVIVLLALGLFYSRRDKYWLFFFALALVFMTIALGGNTPIYRLYYELLPGTKKFRAPSLSFFVVAMSLVTMAGLTLERLAILRDQLTRRVGRRQQEDGLDRVIWIAGGVVVAAVLGGILAGGADPIQGPSRPAGWFRFAFFAALITGALWLWTRERITTAIAAVLLALITLSDLWVIDRRFFHTIPGPEVTFAADDVASFLMAQPEPARVWVLPFPAGAVYRNTGDYLMRFGIEQAGGEHPNPLQSWYEYVGTSEQSYVDWHNFLESPQFLNAANIRYVVSMMELNTPVFREVHRGSALIYENLNALPRAYLVSDVIVAEEPDGAIPLMQAAGFDPRTTAVVYDSLGAPLPSSPLQGGAEVIEHDPDRVVIRANANRPAFLVLADNFYQGWTARIDGEEVPVYRANHTFRGVRIPAGDHEIVFTFEPTDLYLGFKISGAVLLLMLITGATVIIRRSRSATADEEPS